MPWMMIRETEARINVYFTASETVRLGDVGGVGPFLVIKQFGRFLSRTML